MYTYNARKYDCRNLRIRWWQKSTKVMCEEILQLYSSHYSSERLAIRILLSTTGLFSAMVSFVPLTLMLTVQQSLVHLRLSWGSVHGSYFSNIELGGLTLALLCIPILCVCTEGSDVRSAYLRWQDLKLIKYTKTEWLNNAHQFTPPYYHPKQTRSQIMIIWRVLSLT